MAKELKDLTKRSENYSQWYNDLVVKADLAEQSAVRGQFISQSLTSCLHRRPWAGGQSDAAGAAGGIG